MKIAVAWEQGQVFQHFGHTGAFRLYEAADGRIVSAETVQTNGSGHGALAGFLKNLGADAVICGGIGGGAREALAAAGVAVYGGVTGSADEAAAALAAGTLVYDPDIRCAHHEAHGAEEGHSCSSCGSCRGN